MATGIAWVLNLDADLELGAGAEYQPSQSVRRAMKAHAQRLAASLLDSGDAVVDDGAPSRSVRGWPGRAFCPTPRAIRMLRRAGAVPEPHPPATVLRRVNSRAFATALGVTLPGAAFVTTLAQAEAMIRSEPPAGDAWRVKYAFGMAGRNQRVIRSAFEGASDAAFVKAGIAQGGVQIEPNVGIDEEFALHGVLAADGRLRVGAIVRQRCSPRGVWIAAERAVRPADAAIDVHRRLEEEIAGVAAALSAAGFFGPFGIDAFTYRDRAGRLQLQPRSEINARYTMGFAVGLLQGAREAAR